MKIWMFLYSLYHLIIILHCFLHLIQMSFMQLLLWCEFLIAYIVYVIVSRMHISMRQISSEGEVWAGKDLTILIWPALRAGWCYQERELHEAREQELEQDLVLGSGISFSFIMRFTSVPVTESHCHCEEANGKGEILPSSVTVLPACCRAFGRTML